jgi:putative phage-type endonuclease
MAEQGSPEWIAERCGRVTASRIADLMAKTRTRDGWGASRANYAAQLIAERLTGCVAESYTSSAMDFGTANEADARAAYEWYTDSVVQTVGFIPHPSIPMCGASPDGLLGTEGLVEIKVPNTATHIDTLLGQSVPSRYVLQIQWQLAVTGRQWCDFVSFDPRMSEEMRLFVRRVERDNARIMEISECVVEFLAEIDAKIERLVKLYRSPQLEAAE